MLCRIYRCANLSPSPSIMRWLLPRCNSNADLWIAETIGKQISRHLGAIHSVKSDLFKARCRLGGRCVCCSLAVDWDGGADQALFNRLDLQREVLRIDPYMR